MAMNIPKLQEAIEMRAKNRAEAEAEAKVQGLGYFDEVEMYIDGKHVKLDGYNLKIALKKAIASRLTPGYVREHTEQILDAVDRLEDLTAEVDNIQRNG